MISKGSVFRFVSWLVSQISRCERALPLCTRSYKELSSKITSFKASVVEEREKLRSRTEITFTTRRLFPLLLSSLLVAFSSPVPRRIYLHSPLKTRPSARRSEGKGRKNGRERRCKRTHQGVAILLLLSSLVKMPHTTSKLYFHP